MSKFKVTYKIRDVTVSNIIETKTGDDLYFLYLVQTSVAEEWTRKLQKENRPTVRADLVSIEQV